MNGCLDHLPSAMEQLQMTALTYSSLEARTSCLVCSGKGGKSAAEYNIVQPFLFDNQQKQEYDHSTLRGPASHQ